MASVSDSPVSREAGLSPFATLLLGAVLVFAPLIKGGNRPLPQMVLELAAVVLLVIAVSEPGIFRRHLSRTFIAVLAVLAAVPLLQLIPLPVAAWSSLPGRDIYAAASAAVGVEPTSRPLSVVPRATESAWLALLPAIAVFVATIASPDRRLKTLVRVFVAMAVFQAIIGLAQFGTGSAAILWAGEPLHDGSGMGTYANRDHLAGLLEMALPVALAMLAATIHSGVENTRRQYRRPGARRQLGQLFSADGKFNQIAALAAVSLAILVGLVFTRSRTGVALAMLAILVCTIAFARRLGGERSLKITTVFAVVGLAIALEVGLAPVLGRFTEQSILADLRWSIFSATIVGIGAFFPLGSGFGTYPEVFRRFQPGDVPYFVNHAHNDYLEWLFEGGLVAGVLILAFVVLYLRRWPQLWRSGRWSRLHFMQVGAGIGLLLMGLHGLVDFNLHIPANAIYFAFLAGVFFHREEESPKAERRQTRRDPEPRAKEIGAGEPPAASVPNPFAE